MTHSNQILENHPGDNRIFGEKPKVDKNGEVGVQDVLIWFLLTKNYTPESRLINQKGQIDKRMRPLGFRREDSTLGSALEESYS